MGTGGTVKTVDRFGGNADGCMETEAEVCACHIVVNRLGNTDDGNACTGHFSCGLLCAVATDTYDGIQSQFLDIGLQQSRLVNAGYGVFLAVGLFA